MGVDHGGTHVFVAEEFLNGADVVTGLQEVGGEGVTEGVSGDVFGDAGLADGLFDGALESGRVEVVAAAGLAPGPPVPVRGSPRRGWRGIVVGGGTSAGERGSWVAGEVGGGEEVLPSEFAGGIGVFFCQGVGEVDFAVAGGQVFFVEEAGAFDLAAQVGDDGFGEGGDSIFFAFSVTDGGGFVFEVEVFNAQAEAFHEAQAGAVEELGHEFAWSGHVVDDGEGFVMGEDGGEAFGTFGSGEEDDGLEVFVQDFAVEEEDGGEGLILGGGGDVAFGGEVSKEGLDFRDVHFDGVAFLVEEDEAAHQAM